MNKTDAGREMKESDAEEAPALARALFPRAKLAARATSAALRRANSSLQPSLGLSLLNLNHANRFAGDTPVFCGSFSA